MILSKRQELLSVIPGERSSRRGLIRIMENKITWLDIFVTERCNLNCKYCFHSQKPSDMFDGTLSAAIDYLAPMFSEDVTFNLFGGEPFLRPEFCIKWLKELRLRFPKCKFHISTNGTEYNQELVFLLRDFHSALQVSYDGVDQEYLRGLSNIVEQNIPRFIQDFSPCVPAIRLTYTRDTVNNLYESFIKCYNMGVRKFTHQAQLTDDWKDDEFAEYRNQLSKIHSFMNDHDDIYVHFCDCEKIVKQKDSARCSAGRTLVALNTIGEIYPCHRMIKWERFIIGDVFKQKLNRGNFMHLDIHGCKNCIAVATCHPCLAANYEYNGAFSEPLRATCEINKIEHIMSEERYCRVNKDTMDSIDMIRSMVLVLSDLKKSNEEMLKVIKNEKFTD